MRNPIIDLGEQLILEYEKIGSVTANALKKSSGLNRKEIINLLIKYNCEIPEDCIFLYEWKNGICSEIYDVNQFFIPDFYFLPLEYSLRERMGYYECCNDKYPKNRIEFLTNFSMYTYYYFTGNKYKVSSPIYCIEPDSDNDNLCHYDSIESMLKTILTLLSAGCIECVNGVLEEKVELILEIDRISHKLNPNSKYWKRRLSGQY